MTPRSSTALVIDDTHAVHRINMSWLVRLRWAAILGQGAVIAYVHYRLGITLPLAALASILGVEVLVNGGVEVWLSRRPPVSEPAVAAALALDVSCFTGLLYLTGGPLNPFSFLYLVHIALAALVLRPRWAWTLVLFSLGANGALFVTHVPLPMGQDMSGMGDMSEVSGMAGMHVMHDMHAMHGEPLGMHLRGMWVAFAVAAGFIVYFINRVTRALSDREDELSRAREIAARSEKLASMVTLAAGAAHELSTPLSTIAVVAKELSRPEQTDAVVSDARLIREQVDRCRDILAQMAGGAGVSPGEMASDAALTEIVQSALSDLPTRERVEVTWDDGVGAATLVVPPRATAQALRNVLKNGLDASPGAAVVTLRIERAGDGFRLEVTDHGDGMTKEVLSRATEPFFTTKGPGQGMGLGLFLTRSVVNQLGGTLNIDSERGKGTRVVVTLPRNDPAPPNAPRAE